MKKLSCSHLIIIFIVFSLFFSSMQVFAGMEKDSKTSLVLPKKTEKKKVQFHAAGLKTHLVNPEKPHSIDAFLDLPFTEKGYHSCQVHLNKARNKVVSANIRHPFIVEDHMGFRFTINRAVFDNRTDSFVGQGTIEGLHLPGKLYASRICFNSKGIIEVDNLRTRGCGSCRVAGFPYTPEKIKWTTKGIQSRGLLSLRTLNADVTLLITPKGISIEKLNEPVYCLVERRPAKITNIVIRGNRLYVDGNSRIYTGKLYHFKNIPVSATGLIRPRLPKAEKLKPYKVNSIEKKDTGSESYDIYKLALESIGNPGAAGLKILQIADTDIDLIMTSASADNGNITGYIPAPPPVNRVNVFEAEASENNKVEVDKAKMFWEHEDIILPITHDKLTLKTPIKLTEDEESEKKKLNAEVKGIINIMEIFAPGSEILVDNYTIDYKVDATSVEGRVLNAVGNYCSVVMSAKEKIQFDVIQGKGWLGFKCDIELGSISFGPQNVDWMQKYSVMEKPSLYFEIHTDGYVKLNIETGSQCKIPIIPELLTLENPCFNFIRQPGLITELKVKGTFIPPPDNKNVLSIDADFYVDMSGMYLSEGTGATVYVFDIKLANIETAYDSSNISFTIQADFELFGYKLSEVNSRLILAPANKQGGSTFFKGSAGVRVPYICHCKHWYEPWTCHVCHKTIGMKIEIDWNKTVHFHWGIYHFKMPHGTGQAQYDGPFKADGITYNGTLTIDQEKGIQASGTSGRLNSHNHNDTADATLTIKGSWLAEEMNVGSTITGNIDLKLKPQLPGTDGVSLDFNGLTPKFMKDPEDNTWKQKTTGTVEVKYSYTDENGGIQQFDQDCPLRLTISDSTLNIDLDLPAAQGGTYSQSFNLAAK